MGLVLVSGGEALASAGCNAVNAGGFSDSQTANGTKTKTINSFVAGDAITFTITVTNHVTPSSVQSQWWIRSGGGPLIMDINTGTNGVFTRTHTFTSAANLDQTIRVQNSTFGTNTESINVTATCVGGPEPDNSSAVTQSQSLRAMQNQISTTAAVTSATTITGAVTGAIGDAFSGGGNPVTIGPNGVTLNFAVDPEAATEARASTARRVVDDAFSALARAHPAETLPAKTPPDKTPLRPKPAERQWSLWADIRGGGFDRNGDGDLKGTQINVTAGVGYKLTSNVLVGVLAGYENLNYEIASIVGSFKGAGGTVGGYAAWQVAPALRWHAMLGWSRLSYDASVPGANGDFTGSRWLGTTGLTGYHRLASYILEPSASVFALSERQAEWTDSLGTLQASRSFSAGRVAVGSRVIAPWQVSTGLSVSPYVGFYGDWRFMSDSALPSGQPVVGIGEGWSGRVTGGFAMVAPGGGAISVGGEYGGLGADYKIWTATANAVWLF